MYTRKQLAKAAGTTIGVLIWLLWKKQIEFPDAVRFGMNFMYSEADLEKLKQFLATRKKR